MTEKIKKFERFFECCSRSWTSFVLRTMLVKTKKKSWKMCYREAVFDSERRRKLHKDVLLFKSQDVKVHQRVHKMGNFARIWPLIIGETKIKEDRSLEGKIEIGTITASYDAIPQLIDQAPAKPRITKGYITESSFNPAPIIKDLNWPALGMDLATRDGSRFVDINREVRQAIEKNLRGHPSIPFMSLEAVADCYMDTFPVTSRDIRQNTVVCICAPIYFRFEEIAICRKKINVTFRVHKDLMENISVALMPTSLDGRKMRGLRLTEKDFKITDQTDRDLLLRASCRFDKEISYLRMLPFIKDIQIPTSTGLLYAEAIPNLRAKVHQHWDPKNELLIHLLKGEGKDPSKDFERAVAIVLHITGYLTENLGQLKGLSSKYGEVDIFAFPPDRNRIYAVECTIGPIEEKVTKAESCVVRVKAQIKKCHITAVIATSLAKSELPPNTLKEAGKKGILVLHRDLLIEMLERTQGNVRFVDFLENIARENYLEYIAR